MICVPLHIDYYIPLLDVTLIIMCMLWGMCHMLAERHLAVPLWRPVCMFFKKKKKGVKYPIGTWVSHVFKFSTLVLFCIIGGT
jgi:hypothetical protein